MARISEEPAEEGGGEEWALSYGDMITLVFTFFIMLAPLMNFEKETPEIIVLMEQTYERINGYVQEKGLQQEMEVALKPQGIHVVASSNVISFLPGRWDLDEKAYPALNAIGEAVKGQPYYVQIVGHTDSSAMKAIGIVNTNLSLSMRRSISVINYLTRKVGVGSEVFVSQGFGEYQPRAPNDTPEGRTANRRVEIWVLPNLQAFRAMKAAEKAAAPSDTTQVVKPTGT
jgi:flagellar motor protein MotB